MPGWWTSLDLFTKSILCIALFSSLIFIIQISMTFLGIDFHSHRDSGSQDSDSSFPLLSFRNFTNFFLGFGWTAIGLEKVGLNRGIIMIASAFVGILFVFTVIFLFRLLSGIEPKNRIDIADVIHCKGKVYIAIPSNEKGEGKIQVTVLGVTRKYNAITKGKALKAQTPVIVTEILNDRLLLVERL